MLQNQLKAPSNSTVVLWEAARGWCLQEATSWRWHIPLPAPSLEGCTSASATQPQVPAKVFGKKFVGNICKMHMARLKKPVTLVSQLSGIFSYLPLLRNATSSLLRQPHYLFGSWAQVKPQSKKTKEFSAKHSVPVLNLINLRLGYDYCNIGQKKQSY